MPLYKLYRSRDSSVGIATGYGLGGQGSIPGKDTGFSLLHTTKIGCGPTQPATQWVQGAKR
jgi:hypothetical protein